jgi:catechol 2,3-dioxygenase-like lactoylglutathione lyase family enzyme
MKDTKKSYGEDPMSVQLDHIAIPSRDKNASAKLLAEILGVRWEPTGQAESTLPPQRPHEWTAGDPGEAGWRWYRAQRASVYINDSLTLDFVNAREPMAANHYCLRVGDVDFDAVVERIKKAGLKFWSTGVGVSQPDYKINTRLGGKGVYFMEPDGHTWEILTVSYARPLPLAE